MQNKQKYIILTGIVGTIFEWLEYSYYGYLTTRIGMLFFPQFDPRTAMLASMGIFAAGFIMRPLGGIIFGRIGDCKGRKTALLISLTLMSLATLSMGCLPTYQMIGISAPILLLCCRLLQGLAVAGEFNGAAIFLIEHNSHKAPTLAGSWVATASALGMLLGACAAMIVTQDDMPLWAWRVPFFLSFISCFAANYLRYRLMESPLFISAKQQQQIVKFPLLKIIKLYKPSFIKNIFLAALVSAYVYICNVYLVTYLIKYCHLKAITAIGLAGIGELSVVIFSPLAAFLADSYGKKMIMLQGLLLALIATPIVFFAANSLSVPLIAISQILYGIANAFAFAPLFTYIYQFFPTSVRYTGNSVGWSLGVALFGSTSPLLAEFFIAHSFKLGPVFYVDIFIVIGMLIILRNSDEKLGHNLITRHSANSTSLSAN